MGQFSGRVFKGFCVVRVCSLVRWLFQCAWACRWHATTPRRASPKSLHLSVISDRIVPCMCPLFSFSCFPHPPPQLCHQSVSKLSHQIVFLFFFLFLSALCHAFLAVIQGFEGLDFSELEAASVQLLCR